MVVGVTEEQPEGRAGRAEVGRGPKCDIDLERVGEQEDANARYATPHIEVMDRSVGVVHPFGPVGDDLRYLGGLGKAERQVDIRPAVFAPYGGRPDDSRCGDAARAA